jgi:hypothetical protein
MSIVPLWQDNTPVFNLYIPVLAKFFQLNTKNSFNFSAYSDKAYLPITQKNKGEKEGGRMEKMTITT